MADLCISKKGFVLQEVLLSLAILMVACSLVFNICMIEINSIKIIQKKIDEITSNSILIYEEMKEECVCQIEEDLP